MIEEAYPFSITDESNSSGLNYVIRLRNAAEQSAKVTRTDIAMRDFPFVQFLVLLSTLIIQTIRPGMRNIVPASLSILLPLLTRFRSIGHATLRPPRRECFEFRFFSLVCEFSTMQPASRLEDSFVNKLVHGTMFL